MKSPARQRGGNERNETRGLRNPFNPKNKKQTDPTHPTGRGHASGTPRQTEGWLHDNCTTDKTT